MFSDTGRRPTFGGIRRGKKEETKQGRDFRKNVLGGGCSLIPQGPLESKWSRATRTQDKGTGLSCCQSLDKAWGQEGGER